MSAKAAQARLKNDATAINGKRKKAKKRLDLETILTEIENDPNAPPIAKGLVALRRKRDQSGEPYITIEQMWEELGRA